MTSDYPMTADTIARARAAQQQERAAVFATTGVRITDEGVPRQAMFIEHCPRAGCTYRASGERMAQVDRSIAAHFIRVHMKEAKQS